MTGNSTGGSPTGTVSFYVCGPTASPTACTSQADQVGAAVGLTAGANNTATATSASFTPTSTGYWCFAGYYSGDSNYSASSDTSTDECFDVTTASSGTTTAPTNSSINSGGSNTDGVSVAGNAAAGSPTGTVSFYVCGPTASPTACTSQADQVGAAVGLTPGLNDTATATSASFTPTSTGYWCFAGYYSGDSNYAASSDTSTDECFDVVSVTSSTMTTPTSSSIVLSNADGDGVTVTGNAINGSPSGTVSFYVCGPTASPTACTSQADQVGAAVGLTAGANNTATATSASFTPTSTGYWCFAGYYSGDNNYSASSDATTDECFDVTAIPSGSKTTPTSSKVHAGKSNTDQITVTGNAGGGAPTGNVAFYVCGPTVAPASCTSQADQVGTAVALTPGANDTSTATSASFVPVGTGYWCFAGYYSGDSNYEASSDTSTTECFNVTLGHDHVFSMPHEQEVEIPRTNYDIGNVQGNAADGSPTGTFTFYVCGPTHDAARCISKAHQFGSFRNAGARRG